MIVVFLSCIPVSIFIVSSLILFFKSSPAKRANVRLAWLFLVISATILVLAYKHEALRLMSRRMLSYYIPIEGCLFALISPCIYLYLMEIFGTKLYFWSRRVLLHFLTLIPSLAIVIQFASETTEVRISRTIKGTIHISWQTHVIIGTFIIQMLAYLVYFYIYVHKQYADKEKVLKESDKTYMKRLKTAFLLNIVMVTTCITTYLFISNVAIAVDIGLVLLFTEFFYFFMISILQNRFFRDNIVQLVEPEPLATDPEFECKQTKELVSEKRAAVYIATLQQLMRDKKLYLNPNLCLQDIAENLNITTHQVSYILNAQLNKTLSDFVNDYRVAASKCMLQADESSKLTIESIGYDCGFGSKSSFNVIFKKYTGETPSGYKKSYQNKKQPTTLIS